MLSRHRTPILRWWKFDFHTHTPASDDYGKGPDQATLKQCTPREWLLDYMRAGIDCVAITDHNSGTWVDRVKAALSELESEQPDGFRPIYLFPGVEISVHGGVHLLAILGCDQSSSDAQHPSGSSGQQYPGSHFTWVKMGSPSIEGLRLALLDGPLSIHRSDQWAEDPNEHAPQVLESIEISQARYLGRSQPFSIGLNPWLNAFIGGQVDHDRVPSHCPATRE